MDAAGSGALVAYLLHIFKLFLQNPWRALQTTGRFFGEWRMDHRIGVATLRRDFSIHPSTSGDSHPCQPVPYVVLVGIARFIAGEHLPLQAFFDVGCGVGRPLAYLSCLPFERMTGIEINAEVAEAARRNMSRLRPQWRRAGPIAIEATDVLTATPDFLGAIVYLANPFGTVTMRAFVERLSTQILTHPEGEIHLLYVHPHYSEVIEAAFPRAKKEVIKGLQLCHYFRLNAAALAELNPTASRETAPR